MARCPERVKILEVGPRDGLQNERETVPTELKLRFIAALAGAGIKQIEATSFVSPKAAPQLADAAEVARGLAAGDGVTYSALVPNEKGLARAMECGVRRIAVFTAASDEFTRKNIGMSVAESLSAFEPVVSKVLASGMSARGYVSTAFVCPYAGEIAKERVREVSEALLGMGVDEVAISDTIGAASPKDVMATVGFVLERVNVERVALHFHDTYGTAIANVCAGLELGVRAFDSAAGGLGGCPYAPGASGNLATEDLVYLLDRMGIESGVDLRKVVEAADLMAGFLKRDLPSRQWRRLKGRGCGA